MVPDRMARRRSRADKILAIHLARQHQQKCSGEHRQTALAHRTRLPGPQAGTRPWPLRGARLARLSSSRHTVHRRLRIPDLREGSDSPLRTTQRASRQRTSPSRRLSTPRLPRSGLNVTCQTQSPPSASPSPARSPAHCHVARVANKFSIERICDTVRLTRRNFEFPRPTRIGSTWSPARHSGSGHDIRRARANRDPNSG